MKPTLIALCAIEDCHRQQRHINPDCLQAPVDEKLCCTYHLLVRACRCITFLYVVSLVVPSYVQIPGR